MLQVRPALAALLIVHVLPLNTDSVFLSSNGEAHFMSRGAQTTFVAAHVTAPAGVEDLGEEREHDVLYPDKEKTKDDEKPGRQRHKLLFVIYSGHQNYHARLKWARDTWAKELPSSQLAVIGDNTSWKGDLDGFTLHHTKCQADSHYNGTCCKYGHAVAIANQLMQENSELEWAFFVDDDAYIRAQALEDTLLKQPPPKESGGGLVFAQSFGCHTHLCDGVFCGGGGYAANRKAVEQMVGNNAEAFAEEVVRRCNSCGLVGYGEWANEGPWPDAGIGRVFRARGFEERLLPGLYGFMLDKTCFEQSLQEEPLVYHPVRKEIEFNLMHRIFMPNTKPLFSPQDGEPFADLPGDNARMNLKYCVEFRGNGVQCSTNSDDLMWFTNGLVKCPRPKMPHLPWPTNEASFIAVHAQCRPMAYHHLAAILLSVTSFLLSSAYVSQA